MAIWSRRFSSLLFHELHLATRAARMLFRPQCPTACFNHPTATLSSFAKTSQRNVRLPPFSRLTATLNNASLVLSSTEGDNLTIAYEGSDADIVLKEDDEMVNLNVTAKGAAILLSMHIPYQVGLNLNLNGQGTAKISNIENEKTRVMAENYSVELENIKSNEILVESTKGGISCKRTLKGDLDLNCVDGNITTEKIQSNNASITTRRGSIDIGDIYAQELSVISGNGIRMASVHGDCEIESAGDITIGTAEGKINIISEKGNIQIYLTEKVSHADIVSNTGDIALSFSTELGAQLDIEASELDDNFAKSSFSEIRQREQGPCTRYRAEMKEGGKRIISVKSLGGMTTLRASSWMEAVSSFKSSKISR